MANIITALNIRNSAKGNCYQFTLRNKDYKAKTLDDLVDKLYELSGSYQAEAWYQETVVVPLRNNPSYKSTDDFEICWKQTVKIQVDEALNAKRELRDKAQQVSLTDAFNIEKTRYEPMTKSTLNQIDMDLMLGVEYCTENDCIYFVDRFGNHSLIGPIEEITKNRKLANDLSILIKERLCFELGVSEFDLWPWMWKELDKMNNLFYQYRASIEDLKSNGTPPSACKVNWNGEDISCKNLFGYWADTWSDDFIEDLHNLICKYIVNELLPSSLFANDKACLYVETKNGTFKRYSVTKGMKSVQIEFGEYLSMVLKSDKFLELVPKLNKIPYIVHDLPDKPCEFYLQPDWKSNLAKNQFKTYDECKILKTFLDPYDDEEKLFLMAWAYTVLHPSTGDSLGLLIKTGGGTFKTNGYAEMIRQLLMKMYTDKRDLTFTMLKDQWVTNKNVRETKTNGISNCVLVLNDECTEKSIAEYKNFSGSSRDKGVEYTVDMKYMLGFTTKIRCKWLFCSNESFQIQDSAGVYDRRLAIINRMDIQKLHKPYKISEFQSYLERELNVFYDMAKLAYDKICKEHGSLEMAALNLKSVSKNLKEAYGEEDKLEAYYILTQGLKEGELLTIYAEDWKPTITKLCEENNISFCGFKKWILANEKEKLEPGLVWSKLTGPHSKQKKTYKLPRLKPEFMPKGVEDGSDDIDSYI